MLKYIIVLTALFQTLVLSAAAADPTVHKLNQFTDPPLLRIEDNAVYAYENGRRWQLSWGKSGPVLTARGAKTPQVDERPGIIPHGRIAYGKKDIAEAWLAGPTDRYRHGVLGDDIEAGSLSVTSSGGQTFQYKLDKWSVFEDIQPRLADLDGDGRDEIIVVRSYQLHGATVSVFGIRDGELKLLAEAPAIGLPNRWLNPIGAADFDGDGTIEIAIIRTPHIGGILKLYSWAGEKLVEESQNPGFSNHVIGSPHLGKHAVLDWDGDGVKDILVPSQGRDTLVALSLKGGALRELARLDHDRSIWGEVLVYDIDGNAVPDLIYALGDGRIVVISR